MGRCVSNHQIHWERAARGTAVHAHLPPPGLRSTGDLSKSSLRVKNSCQSLYGGAQAGTHARTHAHTGTPPSKAVATVGILFLINTGWSGINGALVQNVLHLTHTHTRSSSDKFSSTKWPSWLGRAAQHVCLPLMALTTTAQASARPGLVGPPSCSRNNAHNSSLLMITLACKRSWSVKHISWCGGAKSAPCDQLTWE